MAIMWELWRLRNDLVWNGKRSSPDDVVLIAKRLIDDWNDAVVNKSVGKYHIPLEKNLRWTRPDFGVIKLNVDVSFLPSSGQCGAGWILRDHLGNCVGGGMGRLGIAESPVVAEAIGTREALSWLKNSGESRAVCVESDCLERVSVIRENPNGAYLGAVVLDIKSMMDQFDSIAIFHVRRSANRVANELAKAAMVSVFDYSLWNSVAPSFIFAVMDDDLN